jgi:uncharacterized protein YegP (UPF0339 family)
MIPATFRDNRRSEPKVADRGSSPSKVSTLGPQKVNLSKPADAITGEHMHFELYASGGQYRWRLRAANSRIIADSGESYWNKQDCLSAISLVAGTTAATPIHDSTR